MSKKKDKRRRELKRRKRKASRGTYRAWGYRQRMNHSVEPKEHWDLPQRRRPTDVNLEDLIRLGIFPVDSKRNLK